jgi:hypothetical protein
LAAVISLYLDENLSNRISAQLRLRGIDAISVQDTIYRGDTDIHHLERASQQNRVLVTTDTDFLIIASEGKEHSGIVFGRQSLSIGEWVTRLELICNVYTMDEMQNHVEYL